MPSSRWQTNSQGLLWKAWSTFTLCSWSLTRSGLGMPSPGLGVDHLHARVVLLKLGAGGQGAVGAAVIHVLGQHRVDGWLGAALVTRAAAALRVVNHHAAEGGVDRVP